MKPLRSPILAVWLGLVLTLISHAIPALGQSTPKPHVMSLPYIQWTYPGSYTTLETDLKFVADPGSGKNWFLAHQFGLADAAGTTQSGGYIGLQSNLGTSGPKGIMFSIWNATTASPGAGATCQSFSGEGVGMQCFKAYPWAAGKTYRLRVTKTGSNNYSAYVIDMSTITPTETFVGQIQAPPGIAGFSKLSTQWAEYYGVTPANCADFPYVKVLWTKPKADSGSILPNSPSVLYGSTGYCKNSAVLASGADNFMEAGNPGAGTRQNLLTSQSKYVYTLNSTEGCGGGGLKPDNAAINTCTGLTRVALANGKFALQAENGYYLSCAGGGGSTVSATARTAGNNETFTETLAAGVVSYKSYGGRYLTAINYGTIDFKCSAYFAGSTEKFTAVFNKALSATVTVSSESSATNQLGSKAIDGGIDGYPGDYSREWVVNGEGAGAWIQLKWNTATAVKQITLYDRPNLNDQIMAGTLLFSDGSSLPVAALPNNGTGLAVSFPAKNLTWVKFRIDQAMGLVGLAELEAY